ncbi:MAG: nucleotidyltransferase family protein [Actinomycetes bacterium]
MSRGEGVAGLVLAAGGGHRYGRPKALVELDGLRWVDRAVHVLACGGTDPILVVTGAAAVTVSGAVVVPNPEWATGMGSSLRVGIAEARRRGAAAVLVILVDQPGISAEAVRRVRCAFDGGPSVVVATYAGVRGHPVLLGRAHFAEVARRAIGDIGARAFLTAHPDLVVPVECADIADPRDLDTPAETAAFLARRPAPADAGLDDAPGQPTA